MASKDQDVIKALDRFIRKYHFSQLLRGLILFLSLSLASYLLFVVLEHYGRFNGAIRASFFYLYCLQTVLIFIFYLFKPFIALLKVGKEISHQKAAKLIGEFFPEVDDKLLNLLQLKSSQSSEAASLIEASIKQKSALLSPISFPKAVVLSNNSRYLKYLAIPLIFFLALLFYSPEILSESTSRIVQYQDNFSKPALFTFHLENKSLSVIKNEDYKIHLSLEGDITPSQVYVNINGSDFLMRKGDNGHFSYQVSRVQSSINFAFQALGERSGAYELSVVPKPLVLDIKSNLTFPKYLKLKDKSLNEAGDLRVPEGTLIGWFVKTEATEDLQIRIEDIVYQMDRKSKDLFFHKKKAVSNFDYDLSGKNEQLNFIDTLFYSVEVIPDLRPQIETQSVVDSLNPKLLYVNGMVKDDHGFKELYFHAQHLNEEKEIIGHQKELIPINLNSSQTSFFFPINKSLFDLAKNESMVYYFEIWDNDGVNGSKSRKSISENISPPSQLAIKEEGEERNDDIKEKLKDGIDLARDIRNEMERLKEKMLDKKTIGFQEKQQIEKLLQKQQSLEQTMDELKQSGEKNLQLNKESQQFDESLMKKQEQLQALFEQVMDEKTRQMLKEMQELMKEMNKDGVQEAIEKMDLNNDELENELDRNLELFKQLEIEQKLDFAKEQLEELKEKQKELQEKTSDKKEGAEELKKEQDEIAKDFEELEKTIEEINKDNKELEEPLQVPETNSLEEAIKKDMKKSAEELGKKNRKNSKKSQEEAQDKMEQLSDQLESLSMQMGGSSPQEDLENIRALLENIIQLSFDQEQVMLDLKSTKTEDPAYVELAQIQKKLKDDAQIVKDSLFALSKRVLQLQAPVNREISKINFNMDKAIGELEERKTSMANNRQQLAMTSMNNLALMLDEAVQKMMQSGNGKCKKPGNGKPSSSSMKSMQQSLNKQMNALKKSLEKGKSPGGKKGKGQKSGGQSKQLVKMAAKQAAIREALQNMQDGMKEGNEGGKSGLKKIGDLMEQTETDLVNKQISHQTILRQQQILTRLLEVEKAEREREKEKKRKATEFQGESIGNQKLFLEYKQRKEREIEFLQTIPPNFNPFYKKKVSEYFNKINQ